MVGGGSGGRLARRLGREMMQLGAARMICRRRPPTVVRKVNKPRFGKRGVASFQAIHQVWPTTSSVMMYFLMLYYDWVLSALLDL